MIIKKMLAFISAIVVSLSLGSCSRPFLSHSYDNVGSLGDSKCEEIILALESKDTDALKAVFSKKALEEAKDIDTGISYVMDFYKGKMISKSSPSAEGWDSINGEKTEAGTRSNYIVTTDQDVYRIFFILTTVNTEHPEEIGVYMLQVIKESDKETQFDWGQKTLCAGVYQPPKE